ncbi:MAG: glycosyltransferase family 9 protein [Nitrospiraceae bacterium]|nr:glycosyltransferase family 9 protein [Nitrospiraceae bacterium]
MKEALVWHQGAVGDLILSLPAIYSIKKHVRPRSLHLISRSDLSDIFLSNGIADETSSNERGLYAGFFSGANVSGGAAEFLGRFDDAYVFMRNRDEIFMENLGRHISSVFRVATVTPIGRKEHISHFQLGQLVALGIDPAVPPCLDYPGAAARSGGGAPVVSIHPGSGGRAKRWRLSGFLDLVRVLRGEGRYRFFVLLGPAETEIEGECRRFLFEEGIEGEIVAGRPLSSIASVLMASSLYVGNDSGITHLAAALGRPVVAIFGPTDPAVWAPLGDKVKIIRADFPAGGGRGGSGEGSEELTADVARAAGELLAGG